MIKNGLRWGIRVSQTHLVKLSSYTIQTVQVRTLLGYDPCCIISRIDSSAFAQADLGRHLMQFVNFSCVSGPFYLRIQFVVRQNGFYGSTIM